MSAIAGVYYGDVRPVPDTDLDVLAAHNRLFGMDGGGTFTAPGLAMQAHVLRFDRYSAAERQPVEFGRGSVLTWDGRLDNRDDLLAHLHYDLRDDVSDAALVALAYQRWGVESFRRLLGDWSLAIWDAQTRTIVLASDYMGIRPLHYAELPDGVIVWSTSLHALPARFDVFNDPDERYVAGRLTFGVPAGVTPFAGVRQLTGGHYLLARPGTPLEVRRYWTYDPSTIRYTRRDDYDERLRELLTQAVRCRLRAEGVVWAHLSGGWDSSSVVCLAHALIQRGQVEARAIQPVSYVSARSPESDERPFIEAVERWCGVSSVRIDLNAEDLTLSEAMRQPRPLVTFATQPLESAVARGGGRVVLSGDAGDAVMFKSGKHRVSLLEPLHHGRLWEFWSVCLAFADSRDQPLVKTFAQLMPNYLSGSLADRYFLRKNLAAHAHKSGIRSRDIATLFGLTPALVARTHPRPRRCDQDTSGWPRTKRALVKSLSTGLLANTDIAPSVRTTHPFTHRPLVEFVLAVPQLAFWDPRIVRAGMRRIMTGTLPPTILERTCKGQPAAALTRMVRPLATELAGCLDECRLITRGYVERAALRRAIASVLDGSSNRTGFVLTCIQLEVWLRSLDRPTHVERSGRVQGPTRLEPAFQER
jgi:asparagine synthase (glutamine-hydrolysing)